MKRILTMLFFIVAMSKVFLAQTATVPVNGDGTSSNPYQIASLENLYWLTSTSSAWSKSFIQTTDIDASGTATWTNGGWKPIGNSTTRFTGSYNGQSHNITNLYISRPTEGNQGFFGYASSATITQLGLVAGNITGKGSVGGLVGIVSNNSIINTCFVTGVVVGNDCEVGGLIGSVISSSTSNCYSTCIVSSNCRAGGLIGYNEYSNINNCYATGKIFESSLKGGLVGYNYSSSTINNCFWDTETSGLSLGCGYNGSSSNPVGQSTTNMKTQATFTTASWDFVGETSNGSNDYWTISAGINDGYPCFPWQKQFQIPIIMTRTASNITATSATCTGVIQELGGQQFTNHGVCWSTTNTSPSLNDNKIDNGATSTKGSFSVSMASLSSHTIYYVRTYAITSTDTIYGNIVIFRTLPTAVLLTTDSVTNISQYSVNCYGSLVDLGDDNVSDYGFCWSSIYLNPTISDSKSSKGSTNKTGTFTASISALPAYTKVYIRSYAINGYGESYGNLITFTTLPSLSTVTTGTINTITATSAVANGSVASIGNPSPSSYGVCWSSTNSTPTIADSKVNNGATAYSTTFSSSITGLTANTKYYVRSYVTSLAGTSYGSVVSFTSEPGYVIVTTEGTSNITATSITCNGRITDLGIANPTSHGFYWSETNNNPTISDSYVDNGAANALKAFTGSLTNLKPNTKYYVRAFSTNSVGTYYSSMFTVNTSPILAIAPASGDGSTTNPYRIVTLENLYWLSATPSVWSKSFIQVENIDASPTTNWLDGGWIPIGRTVGTKSYFSGVFDGQGHTISNLYMYKTSNYQGLFGNVSGATISRLGIVSANITGGSYVGGVTGYNKSTTITNCFITGNVTGSSYIGGISGVNESSTINNCYSRAAIKGPASSGGLVGSNQTSTVSNCYTTGTTQNGYALVYLNGSSSSMNNCFWDTQTNIGATAYGSNSGSFTSTGNITANLQKQATYTNAGWDFVGETTNGTNEYWCIVPELNNGYPILRWQLTKLSVSTQAASLVGSTTATGNGVINYMGTTNVISHGMCWSSTNTSPTIIANNKTDNGTATSIGAFTSLLTGLTPSTTYYARAYAINAQDTSYGSVFNFTTKTGLPTITTQAVGSITYTTAIANGTITDLGINNPTSYGFCWSSTSSSPTITGNIINIGTATATGAFSASLTGLNANTSYYVRAYATNSAGTSYGTVVSFISSAIMAVAPTTGDGSTANPYQIATLENLYWLTTTSSVWANSFVQVADIDASATSTWQNGGWIPIGSILSKASFTGSYNGQNHTISGLYISRTQTNYQGLFGNTYGAIINQLGLVDVNITALSETGGLVGQGDNSTISNCFVTGKIYGGKCVGGIIGATNSSSLNNCYTTCSVYGSQTGGLVGYNTSSTINNCYATGSITGSYCGGLIGNNSQGSVVTNCFWDTQVSGLSKGVDINYGTFNATGKTSAEMKTLTTFTDAGWDFINETTNGSNDYWAIHTQLNNGYPCFAWQLALPMVSTQAVGNVLSTTATGKGTIVYIGNTAITSHGICWSSSNTKPTIADTRVDNGAINTITPFTVSMTGLGINTVYYVRAYATSASGTSYGDVVTFRTLSMDTIAPSNGNGSANDPYQIATLKDLYWLTLTPRVWDKSFIQVADIDAYITTISTFTWTPIGNSTTMFSGSYDGQGHCISNLNISNSFDIGLFGIISGASIKQVGLLLLHADKFNQSNLSCGGLVGHSKSSIISNCFVTGYVSGSNVGSLVGYAEASTIKNCYSKCILYGSGSGGIVGRNYSSTITNCYATGAITGNQGLGAIVGYNDKTSTVTNCFWDIQTTGLTVGCSTNQGVFNASGKTSAEMKTQTTFTSTGWDFVGETTNGSNDYWKISATLNEGYPCFSWQTYTDAISTQPVSDITATTAIGNGTINYLLALKNAKYGICWSSTNTLPTLSNSSSVDEGIVSTTGTFTASMTGLTPNTTYYVRTYMFEVTGNTIYGEVVTFKTRNSIPKLTAVQNKTIVENKTLVLDITDVTASDSDGDVLKLIIFPGSNYSVTGMLITPVSNFYGTLIVPVAVSDGTDTSSTMQLQISVQHTQKLSLSKGWNLISLSVQPANMMIDSVFASIQSKLVSVKSNDAFYLAGQPKEFNNLTLSVGTAYWVQVNTADSIHITGTTQSTPPTLNLKKGWNMVSFSFTNNTTLEKAFGSMLNSILIIKNDTSFWTKGMNTSLFPIVPANGYLVKVE